MKRLNLIISVIAILTFTNVDAGVTNTQREKNMDKGNSESTEIKVSRLRCWQEGKLLFEEQGWRSLTLNNKNNVLPFTHSETADRLSVINMGDTLCVFKSVN